MSVLAHTTSNHNFTKRYMVSARLKKGGYSRDCGCDNILEKYGFALFCWMICFLSIMLSIIYYTTDAGEINWKTLLFNQKTPPSKVVIGNVALGMTVATVRQIHSNLSLIIDNNGMTKGSYISNGSLYSVWFLGAGKDKEVYRMRYDHIFRNIGETEIINRINRRYGRPASSNCRRNASTSASECRFKWWPNGGASLYVFVATSRGEAGKTTTRLAMTATDLRLDGKRMRAASANRKITIPFSIAKIDKHIKDSGKEAL